MQHLFRLASSALFLTLMEEDGAAFLSFLLSPRCRHALESDDAFRDWINRELDNEPEQLHQLRGVLATTRDYLLAASQTGKTGRREQ